MLFSSWLRTLRPHWARTGRQTRPQTPRRRGPRLTVEQLEDRLVPSNFTAANVSQLIADINAANLAGGSNTIALTAPTTAPYNLTAVDNTTDGATGLPVIAANDNLTILGNGDTIARSTVSGTPAFRLVDVAGGASLSLQNLSLQGGLTLSLGLRYSPIVSADGGAIYSQGTLDLNGVTVQNNMAHGNDGGAGNPTQSARGGGIFSNGVLTVEGGSVIQNNQAIGGGSARLGGGWNGGNGWGGGLYVAGGTVTIVDTILASNTAQGGVGQGYRPYFGGVIGRGIPGKWNGAGSGLGGALYIADGTVTLTGDTLGSNSAQGGPGGYLSVAAVGLGGGLYAGGGTITLRNDSVTGNTAKGGIGGVSSHWTAPGVGGGLYIDTLATLYLDDFTLANILNNAASTSDPNIHGSYSLLP